MMIRHRMATPGVLESHIKDCGASSASQIWYAILSFTLCTLFLFLINNLLPFVTVIIQHTDIMESKPSWLSFMLYVGGLTFAHQMPDKQLQIPNLVAAQRFARAILNRYRLRTTDINEALQKLST